MKLMHKYYQYLKTILLLCVFSIYSLEGIHVLLQPKYYNKEETWHIVRCKM